MWHVRCVRGYGCLHVPGSYKSRIETHGPSHMLVHPVRKKSEKGDAEVAAATPLNKHAYPSHKLHPGIAFLTSFVDHNVRAGRHLQQHGMRRHFIGNSASNHKIQSYA